MTDKRLKSFADRLDALEEERKGLVGDIKDVFTEVSSAGYNAKALRKVLAARRKKTDAELEADMELYRAALAEPGATYRSVAEKTGTSKSKLQRLVPRKENGTSAPKPEDGDDGITGGEDERSDQVPVIAEDRQGSGEGGRRGVAGGAVAEATEAGSERGENHNGHGLPAARPLHVSVPVDEAPATPSVGAVADDDLTIPPHLRGPSPANRRMA